ncbi:MAG TPA: BPSS1780 family membrane protein [Pseudomonadales bacterium]
MIDHMNTIGERPVAAQYPWSRGWYWIGEGAQMFFAAPGVWVLLLIMQWLTYIGLSMLPDANGLFGTAMSMGVGLAGMVIGVFFEAGQLLGCEAQQRGDTLNATTLFAAFGHPAAGGLLALALIQLVVWALIAALVVVGVIVVIGTGLSLLTLDARAMAEVILGSFAGVMTISVLVTTLGLLFAMAVWMALPLVLFRRVAPLSALAASFGANLRNVRPLTMYGLGMVTFAILAVIPLLLGFLVWIPIATTSRYMAFCDLFPSTASVEKQTP